MRFTFTVPNRYDLTQIILGESSTNTGVIAPVASSLAIGSFPKWVSEYEYAANGTYYYSIKWKYENGTYSSWSSPRMRGKTGIETDYIIINAPSVSSVYIMNPVSGDVSSTQTSWLRNNLEYYVTIDKTLSGSTTLPLGSDYEFSFTSAYCPLFATVNEIRFEAGSYINNLTDDTVNRIIHKNSAFIMEKYLSIKGSLTGVYTCDGRLLNDAFQRYVICKSTLDSITAIQLSTGGQSLKRLADMTIQYQGINDKIDPQNKKQDLKECITAAWNTIFSGYNFQVGVRGKYFSPMPHPMNDPTFGRLSTIKKNFNYNMNSKFDQVNNNNAD